MDLESSSDSEPEFTANALSCSKSLKDAYLPAVQGSDTPITNDTTNQAEDNTRDGYNSDDYDPEDLDLVNFPLIVNRQEDGELDREDEGVVSWDWAEADDDYDPRLAQWQEEDRDFAGTTWQDEEYPMVAAVEALRATHAPLEVNGVPQLSIFCDGSNQNNQSKLRWHHGGYSVAFRDPFAGTTPFVAQVERNLSPADQAQATGGRESGDGGLDQVTATDFTMLAYATRTLGTTHVELAAIAQSLEVAIKLQDQHQPESGMKISVFSDSLSAIRRIKYGILPLYSNELRFYRVYTNPLMKTIVWQSHYLRDRGCSLEIRWNPRCCALGPELADDLASEYKGWPRWKFCQADVPAEERDGILEKLHRWTDDVIGWEQEEEDDEQWEEWEEYGDEYGDDNGWEYTDEYADEYGEEYGEEQTEEQVEEQWEEQLEY